MRMDIGSNSVKSQTIRIKVNKIKAVKLLSNPNDPSSKIKYSSSDSYWYNPTTGIVYDVELFFPVGKIGYDEDNIPKKIDKDTYVIDKLVPIPLIEEKVN